MCPPTASMLISSELVPSSVQRKFLWHPKRLLLSRFAHNHALCKSRDRPNMKRGNMDSARYDAMRLLSFFNALQCMASELKFTPRSVSQILLPGGCTHWAYHISVVICRLRMLGAIGPLSTFCVPSACWPVCWSSSTA